MSLLIPAANRGGDKRTVDMRERVDGIMYILVTGCQWAAFGPRLQRKQTIGQASPPHAIIVAVGSALRRAAI